MSNEAFQQNDSEASTAPEGRFSPKNFVELYHALGQTNSTEQKILALAAYFRDAVYDDAKWGLYILCGGKIKRAVSSTLLRQYAAAVSELPFWIVEESYHVVGDLAETISLLVSGVAGTEPPPLSEWIDSLEYLLSLDQTERAAWVKNHWKGLSPESCLVFNKVITGELRIGVGKRLVIKALARLHRLDAAAVAHRLSGDLNPKRFDYRSIASATIDQSFEESRLLSPYPFSLAYQLDVPIEDLGSPSEWLAEWKWDGIRGQLIARKGQLAIWSRGEEMISEAFPELLELAALFPDGTVVDGEIVATAGERVADFNRLQQRLNRKSVTPKMLKETPVGLYAYDLLEWQGQDIRERNLDYRLSLLADLVAGLRGQNIKLSPALTFSDWDELQTVRSTARDEGAEGVMLKRRSSAYGVGRRRNDWWKWKLDPYTCDGVLLYAQKGHGRRADLYTDYTFAVWDGDKLVPFAKAYSGLTDSEIREVDKFVKSHTQERFGPVRTVEPVLVFEIGFEGIGKSTRHKSGVAVRFPRILRWRKDKSAKDADSLGALQKLAGIGGADGQSG
jgi:DNA ligase 1